MKYVQVYRQKASKLYVQVCRQKARKLFVQVYRQGKGGRWRKRRGNVYFVLEAEQA